MSHQVSKANSTLSRRSVKFFSERGNEELERRPDSASLEKEPLFARDLCSLQNFGNRGQVLPSQDAFHYMYLQYPVLAKHFRLIEKIGSGSLGTVYKARCLYAGDIFAIKVLDNRSKSTNLTPSV